MKKIIHVSIALWLALGIQYICSAQHTVQGRVIDAHTKAPLPGVNIIGQGTQTGTVTNHLGEFVLHTSQPTDTFICSYVGYKPVKVTPAMQPVTIYLSESPIGLEQVIVSASRNEQARTEVPMAISKISSQTLSETKPATLDQVLNKVSGVYMVNLGNEQHSMSIRQPLSYKSLFLYMEDGLPIRPNGVFNHNALIEMNMAGVQDIEIIKGPASSIYGSEAIGGSVNFITQKAATLPTGKIAVQGDNLGYKRLDLQASNTFGKAGIFAGGYYADRRHGYREHNDFHKLAFTLRSDYRISDHNELTTTATIINYYADMAGSIDSAGFYSKNYPSQHTFTYRKVKALRLRSTFSHVWNNQSKTAFTLFYRNNLIGQNPAYRVKNNPADPLKASGEINESTFQSYGTLVQHTQTLPWWQGIIIAGISVDYSPNQYEMEFITVNRDAQGSYVHFNRLDSLLTDYDVNLLNTAAYAQVELSPLSKLRLVIAARYDRFFYDYHNYLNPDAFSGASSLTNTFYNVSPKIGFTYDLGKNRGFYGNYSIGFVPPQITELYRGVKVPTLAPSLYYNYEAGGWFSFLQKGYLDVSVYQLEGSNEVISVFLDDGTTENRNAGKTLHRGIEYTWQYNPLQSIRLRLGGTHALHRFKSYQEAGERLDGKYMNAAPTWIANAEITYKPDFLKNARISLEWQHVGPYYMDAANTEKYAGFDMFNLRAGYQWKAVEIWGNMLNMTHGLYATNVSKSRFGKSYSPGDPRTISVGLSYHFVKDHTK